MVMTKRKPVSVGEMLITEFMEPSDITQGQLAVAMGVSRKTANQLCLNKTAVTVDTALMLATVFDNTAEFWLNLQRRNDIWDALHSAKRKARINRAKPINEASL